MIDRLLIFGWRINHFFYHAPWMPYVTHRVRCIVSQDGSILLTKEAVGRKTWGLPGGGIRPWESAVHAAARELFEELGITRETITNIQSVGGFNQRRGINTKYYTFVRVEIDQNADIVPNFEIIDHHFFAPADINWEETAPIVQRALNLEKHEA